MVEVRDKKKAYIDKDSDDKYFVVRNWKRDWMGTIDFNDDWDLYCFFPKGGCFFGPEFLRSVAEQMDDIQAKAESEWE